ncbi:UNVERIFIED_CONTAM: hypothetical protein GTU68_037521 [Idotea baltica]|nr:hypothetical protein [Idotea baltica]
MSIIEALLLGLVQGLTEFLPVSSSGHIEIGKFFLGVENADDLLFTLLVHAATVCSILIIFRRDILELIKGIFSRDPAALKMAGMLIVSAIPIAIIGILFEDQINDYFFGNIYLVGVMLVLTGFILLLSRLEKTVNTQNTFAKALIIGFAQAIAIIPGISRSGSTISTALALGLKREEASRFSFLMVLAPIIGATLLKFKDLLEEPEAYGGIAFESYAIGAAAAFVSGLLACKWMIKIVNEGKIMYFSAYCILIGLVSIASAFIWA